MPMCEKCWRDSASLENHAERYWELLSERDAAGKECTPEEQAGPEATICPSCKRATIHQHAKVCVICGRKRDASDQHAPPVMSRSVQRRIAAQKGEPPPTFDGTDAPPEDRR